MVLGSAHLHLAVLQACPAACWSACALPQVAHPLGLSLWPALAPDCCTMPISLSFLPPLPQSCASSTLTPSQPAPRSASCARASSSPPPSLATTRSTSSRCVDKGVDCGQADVAAPHALIALSRGVMLLQLHDWLPPGWPVPARSFASTPPALLQSLGDDDTEAVESSSATLMQTDEGYQVGEGARARAGGHWLTASVLVCQATIWLGCARQKWSKPIWLLEQFLLVYD